MGDLIGMDFQSAMETFAEAWAAANAGAAAAAAQTQALALTRPKSEPQKDRSPSPQMHHHHHRDTDRDSDRSPPQRDPSPNKSLQPIPASSASDNGNASQCNIKLNTSTSSVHENGRPENGGEKLIPSPSVDRKDLDFSKVNGKSLPLHCVVESVSSIQASLANETRNPWKRRPTIETDSYVIIPAATPFCDIVTTALQRLGYSVDITNTARGSIVVKNWKPIALEKVSDNPLISVSDMLGELTSVVTLKIQIIRSKPTQLAEVKDKLLKLLILQSHALLRSSGCPLDEITLSQICRSPLQNAYPFTPEIPDEMRRKFDQWWSNQLTPQTNPLSHKILPFVNPQTPDLDFPHRDALLEHHPHPSMIVHPALQTVHSQYPNQKTRMRTSFDPEMELPKLQRWFQENPHPSRQQIQSYVVQLNALESRRGRKPLDVNNVVYWFKNARAAQKRAEMRGQLSNGFSPGLMLPQDYIKSSPSAPSEDIDNISQHSGDYMDDDRAGSPQLPLSLTIHERNRSPEPQIKQEDTSQADENTGSNNKHNNNNENQEDADVKPALERSSSPARSVQSDDLDVDEPSNATDDYRSPSPDSRRDLPFPMHNSMFSQSIMYMSQYIPQMHGPPHGNQMGGSPGLNLSNSYSSNDERRKRNRTFIDPVTEVPKLEQWFSMNTHPSHNLILKYTEDLNRMPYRQKFPRLESKNVQFWFKNRRAKCKRLKMSLYDPSQLGMNPYHHNERE